VQAFTEIAVSVLESAATLHIDYYGIIDFTFTCF